MPRFSGRVLAVTCTLLVLGLAALAVAAPGGVAGGPDVRFTLPADPREDAPMRVGVSGEHEGEVFATVARRCAPAGAGAAIDSPQLADGRFALAGEAEVPAPGAFAVCAWARDGAGARLLGQRRLHVRAGRATAALDAPARVGEYDGADLVVRGHAEVPAQLAVVIARRAVACDPLRPQYFEDEVDEVRDVVGRFGEQFNVILGEPGRWHTCAVVRETGSGRVLAVARQAVVVAA